MTFNTKKAFSVFTLSLGTLYCSLVQGEALIESESIDLPTSSFQGVMTNPYRTDGFGSQFQTIIFSVIYAEFHNFKYYYTPFTNLEHNYDNDPSFTNKLEVLINFMDNFEINRDVNLQQQFKPWDLIHFFENNIAACANSASLKKMKKIFRANKSKQNYFDCNRLNIAIHIRRPNSHDSRLLGADVPDEFFYNIIQSLKEKYILEQPIFHIYSQGDLGDFQRKYIPLGAVLHIDESLESTFASLVFADILVTSPSGLSYSAGILSDGIVYYIPFWHPPLPHWISCPPS